MIGHIITQEGKKKMSQTMNNLNAFVLFGAPNASGYTGRMLDRFLENLKGYRVHRLNAFDEQVMPCIGCNLCQEKDTCRFDDYAKIDHLWKTSDLIIIATPVYNLSFPPPLKAIFDRTQRYYHAMFLRGEKFDTTQRDVVLLLTSGTNWGNIEETIKLQLHFVLKVLQAKLSYTLLWPNTDRSPSLSEIDANILAIARELSKNHDKTVG